MRYLPCDAANFSLYVQQGSSYFPQSLFKVFDGFCVYRVGGFNDLVDAIEDEITCLLVEVLLLSQV
jgi:hypothetical protein